MSKNAKINFSVFLLLSAVFLFLAVKLLGLWTFLSLCLFLLVCWGIGAFAQGKNNQNILLRSSFFIVVGMQIAALFLFLGKLLGLRSDILFFLLGLGGIASAIFFIKKNKQAILQKQIWLFGTDKKNIFFVLIFLLCVGFIFSYMRLGYSHYYFKDEHHPIYELTIARAIDLRVPPPELSYQGKALKFHFLSAFLTSLFYNHLNIDPLIVVYRVFPFLGFLLFIPLLIYLLILSGMGGSLFLVLAVFAVLFAYPFIVPLGGFLSAFADPLNIFYSITSTPSYIMGYLGFLALLIAVIETIQKKKYLSWLVCVLSAALFMSKGSFFIPLGLGVGIWSLRCCWLEKSFRPILLPFSMLLSVLPFAYFLIGAHSHNQWIITPDRLIWRGLPNWVPFANSVLRLPLMFFATPFSLYGFLSFVFLGAFYWLWAKRKENIFSPIMVMVIIMLVGCSLPLFICEATEDNSRQFSFPCYILLWVIFFYWLSKFNLKRYQKLVMAGLLFVAFFSEVLVFKMYEGPKISYDFDLAQGLYFINRHSQSADVFLIGKHYEDPHWRERKFIGEWENKSFFRTALAGRQTVIEDFKYRGIGMEKDYCQRSVENFKFFYLLTERNKETLLGWKGKTGYQVATSAQEERANLPFVKPFWIGKRENWFSIRKSFVQCLQDNWQEVVNDNISSAESRQWLEKYLNKHQIRFILFERGEKPQEDLRDFLKLKKVFEKGKISVFARQL